MNASKLKQWIWVLTACGLLWAAGVLQGRLARKAEEVHFVTAGAVAQETHPELALLTVVPGGLRAPAVAWLWIRAQDLKQKGRYHDAMQLAELICKLQPQFASVWSFHAWNMAWNISVATRTREERWLWVYNGIELLRDEGIPMNSRALLLYKDIAWIYLFKIAQYTDDMNYAYKQKWARIMQQLLGAPPMGETSDVIEAFRPIAEAPLDKTRPGRSGEIQADQRRVLLEEAAVAQYAQMLAGQSVAVDNGLLDAYNRYTRDDNVAVTRVAAIPPAGKTPHEKALAELINSPVHAAARGKLVAFVRAQILWNTYKMDPEWMLHLMVQYGPLDWRQPMPHGLYWVSYGLKVCQGVGDEEMDTINTQRVLLNTLKELNWSGRMTYVENPADSGWPTVATFADWRYVPKVQQEYLRRIDDTITRSGGEVDFRNNKLKAGHINYLITAIEMLYAGHRRDEARRYFDWIKSEYGRGGGQWDLDIEDFVVHQLNAGGSPNADIAKSQIQAAAQVALVALSRDAGGVYRESMRYAKKVHDIFQAYVSGRLKLPAFGAIVRDLATMLLVEPRSLGYNLSFDERSLLYHRLDETLRVAVYDRSERLLRRACKRSGVDFDAMFPAPDGLAEYRAARQRRIGESQ